MITIQHPETSHPEAHITAEEVDEINEALAALPVQWFEAERVHLIDVGAKRSDFAILNCIGGPPLGLFTIFKNNNRFSVIQNEDEDRLAAPTSPNYEDWPTVDTLEEVVKQIWNHILQTLASWEVSVSP